MKSVRPQGPRPTERARVLIVDDSALMRRLLREVLAQDPALEVVDVASNALVAWEKIQTHRPDVLTLDVEMPHMDGLSFLEKLMRAHPLPVVMVSTLTQKGCETTLRALELGAVDFVTKPKIDVERGTLELADVLIEKVKTAARARLRRHAHVKTPVPRVPLRKSAPGPADARLSSTDWVIAIGASTGGTEALRELLVALPATAPAILVVQHMPEKFTGPFARRLDACCALEVKEAAHGDPLLPGRVLIAPGNQHMEVLRRSDSTMITLNSGAPVHHHRPSVDVLFESCARQLGARALGVILTGMGSDGAVGLLAMRRAGARTVAQDEATSVVFGMPREAIANGSVETVAALENIAPRILHILRERPARS